jgi:hypothetical protein
MSISLIITFALSVSWTSSLYWRGSHVSEPTQVWKGKERPGWIQIMRITFSGEFYTVVTSRDDEVFIHSHNKIHDTHPWYTHKSHIHDKHKREREESGSGDMKQNDMIWRSRWRQTTWVRVMRWLRRHVWWRHDVYEHLF